MNKVQTKKNFRRGKKRELARAQAEKRRGENEHEGDIVKACQGKLLAVEEENIKRSIKTGLIYAGKSDNCKRQRAIVGHAFAEGGGGMGRQGNPVKSWHAEEMKKEKDMKKMDGMMRIQGNPVNVVDWKEQVLFFFL